MATMGLCDWFESGFGNEREPASGGCSLQELLLRIAITEAIRIQEVRQHSPAGPLEAAAIK